MPRLKNIKHEAIAQDIMRGEKNKYAYNKQFPLSSEKSAESNSSRLISTHKFRDRCYEIMESKTGLRLEDLLTQLKECTKAEYPVIIRDKIEMYSDNAVRLQALTTGFKLLGLLSGQQLESRPNISFNISNINSDKLLSILDRLERIERRQDSISGDVINP